MKRHNPPFVDDTKKSPRSRASPSPPATTDSRRQHYKNNTASKHQVYKNASQSLPSGMEEEEMCAVNLQQQQQQRRRPSSSSCLSLAKCSHRRFKKTHKTFSWLLLFVITSSLLMVLRYHYSLEPTLLAYDTSLFAPSTLTNKIQQPQRRAWDLFVNSPDDAPKRPPLPPPTTNNVTVQPVPYHLFPNEYNNCSFLNNAQPETYKTTSPNRMCGTHAKIAALEGHGTMEPLSQDSIVVITGILEPVGVELALRLYRECHVQHIIGVDAVLPNVRHGRMNRIANHYARLHALIPNFPRLIVPDIGLPLDSIVKTYSPTHILHLAGISSSTNTQRHYQENLLEVQQLMKMMVNITDSNNNKPPPHVVYVSHKDDSLSSDTQQVLASTYSAIFGDRRIRAVGLRLPQLYGSHDENSILSQVTMTLLRKNERTMRTLNMTNNYSSLDDENGGGVECLFVDDAVDVMISAMQFRPAGLVSMEISSNTTLSMVSNQLVSSLSSLSSSPPQQTTNATNSQTAISSSPSRKLLCQDAKHWLGWTPSTTVQQGVSKLIANHLAHEHPYGSEVVQEYKSFSLPPQRVMFPCASECARQTPACMPTVFDSTIKVSRSKSRGCKYVIYSVNLWPDINDLHSAGTLSDDPEQLQQQDDHSSKICRYAFVSSKSPLVKHVLVLTNRNATTGTKDDTESMNGELQWKNWTLIWVNGTAETMSEAEYTLAKLSPRRFFSDTVARATYIDPFKFPVPSEDYFRKFLKTLDPSAKNARLQKEYRSRTKIFRFIDVPPRKARRVIFATLQDMTLGDNIPPRSPLGVYVNHIIKRDGVKTDQDRLKLQLLFYTYTAHLVQMGVRRPEPEMRSTIYIGEFPFEWLRTAMIVHDLREEESRQLRCEWYDEHLYWGNSDLEDLSLAFVLAKRRILGHHAPPPLEGNNNNNNVGVEEAGWIAIRVGEPPDDLLNPRILTNEEDVELYIRTFAQRLRESTPRKSSTNNNNNNNK